MKYRLISEAGEEIDHALTISPNPVALEMAIGHALATIARNPKTAARVARTRARQLVMRKYPYSIIYLPEATEVVVFAFAHHKRKPGYWKYRLKKP